ncbi:MAG: methyltransferase type 11 [Spirochaetes bacterium]|nr:MAG: methyltransferase type 11 [Spirochaetota bacterium]
MPENTDEKTTERTYTRADSKVEVKGFEARHYDMMLNTVTLGAYPFFIRKVVREMQIQTGNSILVFGSGTGRNLALMDQHLSGEGRIIGLDIGEEMLRQARRRFDGHPYISIENRRIDEDLPYQGEFDKVFISFVLHGFIQEDRVVIIKNAFKALRPGGEFIILDYNEFELASSPWLIRSIFKMECPLATDFAGRDLQGNLEEHGFDEFRVLTHFRGYIRLLAAKKTA